MVRAIRLLSLSGLTIASLGLLIWGSGLVASLAAGTASAAPAAQPATITVLSGGGQDTLQALNFFPQNVRIRAGDTITWKANADEIHTVSFVAGVTQWGPGAQQLPIGVPGELNPGLAAPIPGAPPEAFQLNPQIAFPTGAPGGGIELYGGPGTFVSSGIMERQSTIPGMPANDTFSLTFTTPGTYMYVCLVHNDRMFGWVDVAAPGATDVPNQAQVDAQANAELAQMMGLITAAKAQGEASARSEPGPNGTSFWYVRAGNQDLFSGDSRGQVLEFMPRNQTVRVGDTVIWSTNLFHTVSFIPSPPTPLFFDIVPQPAGPPLLPINPEVLLPVKPAATYDPTRYFNSGVIGPFTPAGDSWALTFDRTGTFEYVCIPHEMLGMKGTITVVPR